MKVTAASRDLHPVHHHGNQETSTDRKPVAELEPGAAHVSAFRLWETSLHFVEPSLKQLRLELSDNINAHKFNIKRENLSHMT